MGVGGKRGLAEEKRGSSGIKAALHILVSLYGRLKKHSCCTIKMTTHKEALSADRRASNCSSNSIHKLWQSWWLTLRKAILGGNHKCHRELCGSGGFSLMDKVFLL